jgi:hypothetical protein
VGKNPVLSDISVAAKPQVALIQQTYLPVYTRNSNIHMNAAHHQRHSVIDQMSCTKELPQLDITQSQALG